ncbi:MAG: patatin-like phospholipase family protein [Flavobacteriales bacterium]|nr:patatin-like phospholipase family protein [Flavobacteriales bacterium]MDG2246689.1 patatin-like phospholipase family protein [Flavobacteriales bacterium]
MNAAQNISTRQRIERILLFFPFQLLFLHFKKNLFLLFFWFLLFGYTLNYLAARYGVAYQFLFPEYMGKNSAISFGMVGFALGGFILAFNLYTYILHGFRFPFIATLNRPFQKFSVNNFIIPVTFVVTYIVCSVRFQFREELLESSAIVINMIGFVIGLILFLIASLLYFRFTNKNLKSYELQGGGEAEGADAEPIKTNLHRRRTWSQRRSGSREWRTETYLVSIRRIALARSSKHYNPDLLNKVFSQNHLNASLFELALLVSFILLGSLGDNQYFVLPAAASVMLFFTMMLMFISALHSWIRGWTLTVFFLVFFLINYSMPEFSWMNIQNKAYGLNYDVEPAPYTEAYIRSFNGNDSLAKADFDNTIEILQNWRKKNQTSALQRGEKPKLVIINTSGGGSRSALWTMTSLSYADSVLGGGLLDQTALISGSSGGMVGAAYLRELHLKEQQGTCESIWDETYPKRMGKDLLNPVIFSIATNDFFIRYKTFEDGGHTYTKDRAWAFEKQLNSNTDQVLNKRLSEYVDPEKEALIPMMVMAPTIMNDGRRLLISAQPMSYLTQNKPVNNVEYTTLSEDVEYLRLFENQSPLNLRFTSALRMNATFPYVLPSVTLPSEPPIDVMDAGMRDNFGMKTTMQFLYTFRNWINSNTSGVVIIQVRDVDKGFKKETRGRTLFNKITAPLGSVYGNITRTQDYNNDQMFLYLSAWFDNEISVVPFQLVTPDEKKVSLSWHLTSKEKQVIANSTSSNEFQSSVEDLEKLLGK